MSPQPPPPGTCDCHVHIYEDRFALAASATFKPPHAPVSAYRQVQRALGLQRAVLVQPTGYGFDNACLLDALAQLGDSAIGVAVVPPDVSDAELQRLHAGGVRGVRYMMLGGTGPPLPWDTLQAMAARIAPLGWHIDLQFDGRETPQRQALIDRLPGTRGDRPHRPLRRTGAGARRRVQGAAIGARPRSALGQAVGAVRNLECRATELRRRGAAGAGAGALAPERCLWASNWPHPNRATLPADADLLALLTDWVPDAAARRRILVDNPALAYGF